MALLSAYGFDEGSGLTAHDETGVFDVTLTTANWVPSGHTNSGIGDGAFYRVQTGPASGLSGLTVMAWVKVLSHSGEDASFFELGDDDFYIWGPSRTLGAYQGGTSVFVNGEYTLSLNTWYHLAVVFTGSQIRFLVNGTQVADGAWSGVPGLDDVQFCCDSDGSFVGDDLRFFNEALSAAEIATWRDIPVGVAPEPPIPATLMSEPYPNAVGDVADGITIIPNPTTPNNSVAIGTNKSTGSDGGLYVFDMDGEILSSQTGFTANSVDWRDTTGLSGWDGRILVMTCDRTSGNFALVFFWFDRTTRTLTPAGTIPIVNEPYGTCLGINGGVLYAYMTERGSDDVSPREFYQASLVRSGDTVTLGSIVRQFTIPSVVEGMAVSDADNALIMSQEDVGLFALDAGPAGGDWDDRLAIDLVGSGNLVADVEDVAIVNTPDGPRLLVSSQGDNSYHVYAWDAVAGEYVHEMRFTLVRPDGTTPVTGTDGLDALHVNLGTNFPNGLIAVHDDGSNPSRFAFVDAGEVFGPLDAPPVPTGVTADGGDHEVTGGFTADPGATQFRGQWRRTDLVRPSTTTQPSAPAHLRRISQENLPMPSGYTYDFTGDGVPYAQFDTGCRVTHNEFGGRYVTGGSIAGPWNTDTAPNPPFSEGHGTGVAAMAIGATYGVAKDAILYSVNSGDEAGPTMEQYEDSAAWLIANKPANRTVALNISNGFPLDDIPRLEAFLDSLYLNGIAVFVAAGNTGEETPYNALQYRIFVVGASTQADAKASYSNYGDGIDLYAPISPTTTAGRSSDSATRVGDGTSEASPMAAGVALKILEGNPELAPWRLYEVLRSQAFVGKISGIPTGTNRLLNGNANTDEWSDFPVDGDTFTLDGLDADATYEVRFAQMVDGEWSDWSDSATATTDAATAEGDFAAAMTWGPAEFEGERDSEGGFTASVSFGPAVAEGEMSAEGDFATSVAWGPAEASGGAQPEGDFAASISFGPAVAEGASDPRGGFSSTLAWGPAEASGQAAAEGGFSTSLTFGPAAADGAADHSGGFATSIAWGPAEATGAGSAAGGFVSSYAWGPAEAAGQADHSGGFEGAIAWGPATASGQGDAAGDFTTAYAWGPADASGSSRPVGEFATSIAWGPAEASGESASGGDFDSTVGWGPAAAGGERASVGSFGASWSWGPAGFAAPDTAECWPDMLLVPEGAGITLVPEGAGWILVEDGCAP